MKGKLFSLAALTVVGAGLLTSHTVFAQSATETAAQDPVSSLVQKIAQKFNLQESEVQTVFAEHREERQAERQVQFTERLAALVSDGSITEAQKQLIITKHAELQNKRSEHAESFHSMTPEERRTALQAERTALEEWATANGIDLQYLQPFGKMDGHGRQGGPRMD